jgi:hypothetical protein
MEQYDPTEELKTVIEPACEKARGELEFFKSGQYHSGYTDWENTSPVRLRLDWEIEASAVGSDPVADHILRLMYTQVAADLDDLFQNGDRETVTGDPLMSAADGSRKTGKKLVGLEFAEQSLIVVFVTRKDSYEYTLFVNLVPEWS